MQRAFEIITALKLLITSIITRIVWFAVFIIGFMMWVNKIGHEIDTTGLTDLTQIKYFFTEKCNKTILQNSRVNIYICPINESFKHLIE